MQTKIPSAVCRTALSAVLLVSVTLTSCETPGQTALLGAATGAAIGGAHRGRGSDALVGAAIGAGAGYIAGTVVRDQRERAYYEGRRQGRCERGYYDRYGYWHRHRY